MLEPGAHASSNVERAAVVPAVLALADDPLVTLNEPVSWRIELTTRDRDAAWSRRVDDDVLGRVRRSPAATPTTGRWRSAAPARSPGSSVTVHRDPRSTGAS